ncbi:MAG: hypothetical protein E6R05_01150 [Candidatus Moraniibacteriota bacterium]|nr:MAG: hypothetical protein E6R05_01150 [Candidatus Moranbacteria bacterium]
MKKSSADLDPKIFSSMMNLQPTNPSTEAYGRNRIPNLDELRKGIARELEAHTILSKRYQKDKSPAVQSESPDSDTNTKSANNTENNTLPTAEEMQLEDYIQRIFQQTEAVGIKLFFPSAKEAEDTLKTLARKAPRDLIELVKTQLPKTDDNTLNLTGWGEGTATQLNLPPTVDRKKLGQAGVEAFNRKFIDHASQVIAEAINSGQPEMGEELVQQLFMTSVDSSLKPKMMNRSYIAVSRSKSD